MYHTKTFFKRKRNKVVAPFGLLLLYVFRRSFFVLLSLQRKMKKNHFSAHKVTNYSITFQRENHSWTNTWEVSKSHTEDFSFTNYASKPMLKQWSTSHLALRKKFSVNLTSIFLKLLFTSFILSFLVFSSTCQRQW